jgi:hypothetical protein
MKLECDQVADAAYFGIASFEIGTNREIEPGIIVEYDTG